jgi:acetyltransferase-like isoleucine patch superfamily enzyme
MGATVLTDVPPGEVWVGSPARRLRAAPAPALAEAELDARTAHAQGGTVT